MTEPAVWGPAGPSVDSGVLTSVAQACRDTERLEFTYTAAGGESDARHVEPYKLVLLGRRWYLVAYDLDAPGLAQLPPRSPGRTTGHGRALSPAGVAHRGRGGLRPNGYRQPAGFLLGRGCGAHVRRRRPSPHRPLGQRRGHGGRTVPPADDYRLTRLAGDGARIRRGGLRGGLAAGAGRVCAGLGATVHPRRRLERKRLVLCLGEP